MANQFQSQFSRPRVSHNLLHFMIFLFIYTNTFFLYFPGIYIQTVHHVMCGLLMGLCFFNMANDGTQMFNHLKMCVGIVLFFAYTQIMAPVLVCEYCHVLLFSLLKSCLP